MDDDIIIGGAKADAKALAHRVKRFADRLGVSPCDPHTTKGGILVYCGSGGPVYDLLELLDVMLDRIAGKHERFW